MRLGRQARPKRLLFAEMSREEGEQIDSRLAALGRGLGAMRLRVGEGLLRLEAAGGVRVLGFPTLESYCREALGRSGRWGADVRGLARRLSELPVLRAALVSGRLTSSMVELLARVATLEDEGEWVEEAARSTVRAMRARVKDAHTDVREVSRVTITATVDRIDAWAFERARMMVEAVGARKGDGAIEAMLAEGLSEILAMRPDVELPEGMGEYASEASRAWRDELARMREEGEIVCETRVEAPTVEWEVLPEIAWPGDVIGIDGVLRGVARELAWRDLELADLGRRCFEHEVWRRQGWASFEQYCRERVGLSPSSVASRVALSRRVIDLPEIEDSVAQGRIGYESAALIARVAGGRTVEAWIGRAERRTVKHLREEVECVELRARAEGVVVQRLAPPDEESMAEVVALEREVIGVVTGCSQMSGGEEEPRVVDLTTRMVRVSVSEEIGRFWRTLESVHARLWLPGSFVAFLVRAVMKAWTGAMDAKVAYADVYVRDRWRCASPVCTSRNVTPHHIVFRSRGGGEERGNLVAVCETCHLELIHGGWLTVKGDAELGLAWKATGWAVRETCAQDAVVAEAAAQVLECREAVRDYLGRSSIAEPDAESQRSRRKSRPPL